MIKHDHKTTFLFYIGANFWCLLQRYHIRILPVLALHAFPPTKQFHAIFHLWHHVFAIIRFTNYTPTLVCAFNTSCFCLLFYHVLWREVGHIYDPLSGISGLLFDSPFPSSLTFFYLVLLLTPSSYGPFSWLFPKFLQHFLSRQR